MFKLPRTLSDFRLIEKLVRSNYSDKEIESLYRRRAEWRSDVYSVWGKKHCSLCELPISLHECQSCGQTLYQEGEYL